MITFDYEQLATLDDVRKAIKSCEGRHVQQSAYSTFMGALTQVCFTCHKIRSTIAWQGNTSWNLDKSAQQERAPGRRVYQAQESA